MRSSSSSSSSPPPSSSQHDLRAKVIRAAYHDVLGIREELAHDAAQLHRVYYKSKAQHRSAKWFQTLDALRKCYRRILYVAQPTDDEVDGVIGPLNDAGSAQYTRDVQVDGSLPNRAGRVERRNASMRRRRRRGYAAGTSSQMELPAILGTLEAVRLALIAMWCSLWEEKRDGHTGLPKYDRPTTQAIPSLHTLKQCALSLFALNVLLEELSLRSQRSFSILTAQLRTPPAPTFAPLIAILLPLAAAADRTANKLLWGATDSGSGSGEAKDALTYPFAELYNRVQRAALQQNTLAATADCTEVGEFVLDAKTRSNAAHWQRMLNAVHESAQHVRRGRYGASSAWLPSKLSKPTELLVDAGESFSLPSSELPAAVANADAIDDDDDEDVGEAI